MEKWDADSYTTDEPLCPSATKAIEGCYAQIPSGTSFSAAMVSGAAALVWSAYPELDNEGVRRRLEETAVPMPGEKLGHGRLDIFEAVFDGSFSLPLYQGWWAEGYSGPGLEPDLPAAAFTIREMGDVAGPPLLVAGWNPVREAGNRMLYVGNDGSDLRRTEVRQSFEIQPGVQSLTLSFNYYFISEEVPEYIPALVCWQDRMWIRVVGPTGESVYSLYQPVESYTYWDYIVPLDDLDIGEFGALTHPRDISYPNCWVYVEENDEVGVALEREWTQPIPINEPGTYTFEISVSDISTYARGHRGFRCSCLGDPLPSVQ